MPIIAANMDTTGTFEMVKALSKHKCIVAMSKHIKASEYVAFLKENPVRITSCLSLQRDVHMPLCLGPSHVWTLCQNSNPSLYPKTGASRLVCP